MPDGPGTIPQHAELLTTAEVAQLLRCSIDSVRRRAKSGNIPGFVEGMRPLRFRSSDIRAWLGLDGEQQ